MKTRTRAPEPRTVRPRMTKPGDAAEREADRLADAALDPAQTEPLAATATGPALMRQAREPEFEEDDDYDLALKSRSSTVPEAPAGFLDQVRSTGGGRPLDPGVRGRMEEGFGRSFAGVRVHSDSESARLSDAIDARAFTHGSDVFFGGGEYAPDTEAGDRLLAHELAHTLQQASPGRIARQPKKKVQPPPKKRDRDPARMTDAEKIRMRAEIRRAAAAWTKRRRDEFDKDPAIDPAERAKWEKAFDDAIRRAKTIPDAAERAGRLAYLETERDLFKGDAFYAWLMTRGKLDYSAGIGALATIGDPDPKAKFGAAGLATLAAHRARMRAGSDAYATFIGEGHELERRMVRREELETAEVSAGEVGLPDDATKTAKDPPTGASGGALGAETLEERELLEELHTELAEVESEEGLDYDEAAFLAELAKLEPWDRKDFYAFVRSMTQPGAPGPTTPKTLDQLLEMFNKLDPVSREALMVNREISEAEPGVKEALPESVRLKLEGEVAAQKAAADDARSIQSDLDRIRAKALPADIANDLKGVDFGVSPFFDEVAMLLGLLAGAGERSTLVKEAGDELLRAIVQFRKDIERELRWIAIETAALAAVSVVTKGLGALIFGARIKRLVARIKTIKKLIETAQKVYDTANRIKRIVDIVNAVRNAYPRFLTWFQTASTEYARIQRLLESFDPDEDLDAKLAEKEDELIDALDEQLEGQLGDILEMLYIDEGASREELQRILFDIPRGLTALQDMWWYYRSSEKGKPHFANVLAVRAFRAGRYLSPFVGFASAEIAAAFRAAFPDRPLEQRALRIITKALATPDRRKRHRGLFGRLSRKRYKIDPSQLIGPLKEATQALKTAIDPLEPGSGPSEAWTPSWFKRAVRREIKVVNQAFRNRTVEAKLKPPKKGGPAGPPERVPIPPFRVRVKRPGRNDTKLFAVVKVNPPDELSVDRLTMKHFATEEGVDYTGDEPRKEAIRRFLKDKGYDVLPHPTGGEFIRLHGANTGSSKRPYLRIVGNRIKPGIDKDAYKPFVDSKKVVGGEHDLPEGYFLSHTAGALTVYVSLKKFLAPQQFKQLGLDDNRRLIEGKGKAAPMTVAEGDFKKKPATVVTEGYDYVASLDTTLAPVQPGSPPFKDQKLSRRQWDDQMRGKEELRKRPKELSGKLGYVIRARAFGDKLDSRYLPELREEDDKGHLVARRFGSDEDDPYWNLVPMLRRKNQFPGEWYRMEEDMADVYVGRNAIVNGYVRFALSLIYPTGKTRRPSRLVAKYQAFDANNAPVPGGEHRRVVENE